MRVAILTSSRADYSIYLPLLKVFREDSFFNLTIIAFGTHLSHFHGYTIDQIFADGFEVDYCIETVQASDSTNSISTSMALTFLKFSEFWNQHKKDFDLVFCLGDRYEMFSAVMAAIPYQITFAHLHGGEETFGSIDNIFRHSITQACKYHYVSCEVHAQRVKELIHCEDNVFNVGALALDNLQTLELYAPEEFFNRFGVDLRNPTILVTVHPESVSPEKNLIYAQEVSAALLALVKFQVLITMPNADTNGYVLRARFLKLPGESKGRISCFESLGSKGYFSALKYCSFMLGNTSSGIIEAASFGKWVINAGDRQHGRQQSNNILNVDFKRKDILAMVEKIKRNPDYTGTNIYYKTNVSRSICSILKNQNERF